MLPLPLPHTHRRYLQVCQGVGDVVARVAEVLCQALNGLGAAGQCLHGKANKCNLHSTQDYKFVTRAAGKDKLGPLVMRQQPTAQHHCAEVCFGT